MPIPSPSKKESKNEFISRCMGDKVMVNEYDQKQRAAICYSKWENKKAKASYIVATKTDEFIYIDEKTDN